MNVLSHEHYQVFCWKKMFKSLLLWFPFSCGALGVWLGCIPVQFSINISGFSTSYICRSQLWEWLLLHKLRSLWRVDFWPFSFPFYQVWFWTFSPSICHIQFSGLYKFRCGFGVERCSVFRRAVSGFGEHLFLYTRLASKHFRHISEFRCVFFSCLFFHTQVLQFFPHVFIARVSMSCAVILWVWLKDEAEVFSVVCILITNMKWQFFPFSLRWC